MDHHAYLLRGRKDGRPDRRSGDRELRLSMGQIPLLWLVMYAEDDLRYDTEISGSVPYLVAERDRCIATYRSRIPWLQSLFSCHRESILRWEQCLQKLDAPFLKVEFGELDGVSLDFERDKDVIACAIERRDGEPDLESMLYLANNLRYKSDEGALFWKWSEEPLPADNDDLIGVEIRSSVFWQTPLILCLLLIIAASLAAILGILGPTRPAMP